MITVLMVLDAVVGLLLIASVIMQTPKSAGMGMGGGSDTVFSSSARGLDALLARCEAMCQNYTMLASLQKKGFPSL